MSGGLPGTRSHWSSEHERRGSPQGWAATLSGHFTSANERTAWDRYPGNSGERGRDRQDACFIDPVQQWEPAEASPSGMTHINGTLFIANLRGQVLTAVPVADPSTSTTYYDGESAASATSRCPRTGSSGSSPTTPTAGVPPDPATTASSARSRPAVSQASWRARSRQSGSRHPLRQELRDWLPGLPHLGAATVPLRQVGAGMPTRSTRVPERIRSSKQSEHKNHLCMPSAPRAGEDTSATSG
jgi:hypothetical protein